MKPPTEGPKGGAGDSGAAPSGIVPEYLQGDWRHMRARLHEVSVAAEAAALASTSEEVRSHIGEASMGLIDADFMLRNIMRRENHPDD